MKRTTLSSLLLITVILVSYTSCDLFESIFGTGATEVSRSITPGTYKIAVISMDLTDSAGGTTKTVIDATAADPVIINLNPSDALLSGEARLEDVINAAGTTTYGSSTDALISGTTYDGFSLIPLYIEMSFPSTFHVPSMADESGYSMMFSSDGDEDTYMYRFIFNIQAGSNLWKKDILVYLSDILNNEVPPVSEIGYPDGWYWMRRSLEGTTDDFLVSALPDDVLITDGIHPGGTPSDSTPGFDNVIDLFSDPFWGATEDLDSSDTADYIRIWTNPSSHSRVAEREFEIIYDGSAVSLDVDIYETLNFWYESDTSLHPTAMASDTAVIDFGPVYGTEEWGDHGFAPFFPGVENTGE